MLSVWATLMLAVGLPTVALAAPIAPSKPISKFGTLSFSSVGNVTRTTFNNPPINIVDTRLASDLLDFLTALNSTSSPPKVVIFDSANPDVHLDHLDINQLLLPSTSAKQDFARKWVLITRLLQSLTSTIFIAEINGVGWSAGVELPVQMDLRYAGPKARIGSIENAVGVSAGVGGQLFLGSLVGKARALEHNLAIEAWDGPTGTEAGLFNDYYDSAEALRKAVDNVAGRIALLTSASINATKFGLSRVLNPTIAELDADLAVFNAQLGTASVQAHAQKYLKASENQTSLSFELNGPDSYLDLDKA